MNGEDFYQIADEMLEDSSSPAIVRCAIGRAYYAVFNVAADLLRRAQCDIPRDANGHVAVSDYLRAVDAVVELQKIGQQLSSMRSARNRADYELHNVQIENAKGARLIVDTAKGHIQSLKSEFGGSNRHSILNSLRAHERRIGSGRRNG